MNLPDIDYQTNNELNLRQYNARPYVPEEARTRKVYLREQHLGTDQNHPATIATGTFEVLPLTNHNVEALQLVERPDHRRPYALRHLHG